MTPSRASNPSSLARALLMLALCAAGCQRAQTSGEPPRRTPSDAPRAAAVDASAPRSREDVPLPVIDAGDRDVVDLLRAPGARIAVSSAVQNNTERPAHLIDDDLDTAWSSRTGELTGAEIDFRVPDDATVTSVQLTVGMTRRTDGGDLFTLNPRVAEVAVYREGELVARRALEVASRALQPIAVDRPGGFYRVVVTQVQAGTRSAWREVSVSEFGVRGRWPGALSASRPAVEIGALARDALPTQGYALADGAALPPGCFAWSPQAHAAACAVGCVGNNMSCDEGGSGTFQAAWRVAFVGDARARPLDLVPRAAADREFSAEDPPPASVRARLDAALTAGGYVALAPLYRRLRAGTPLEWAPGGALLWTRRRTSRVGENAAARYTDTLTVRWGADAAPTPVMTRVDAPVGAPEYAAYVIPGERFVVLSSLAQYGDEGVSGQIVEAWRCDRTTRRCE